MKHILTAIPLLFAFMAGAQIDPGFFQPVAKTSDQPAITLVDGSAYGINCESDTMIGAWKSDDIWAQACSHNWVYADYEDVNAKFTVHTVYCPCGCDQERTEARICSVCFRHERRVVTTVFREKQSEYQRLLNKKEKKHE